MTEQTRKGKKRKERSEENKRNRKRKTKPKKNYKTRKEKTQHKTYGAISTKITCNKNACLLHRPNLCMAGRMDGAQAHRSTKKYKHIRCSQHHSIIYMKRSPRRSFMIIAVTTPLHQRSPHRSIIYTAVTTPLHQRSPHRFILPSGHPTAPS